MRRDTQRFEAPIGQTEERADAEPAKTGGVSALRRFHPPVEIAFRPGGVQLRVKGAVVSFLIHHESFCAGPDDGTIILRLHRADFERDAGEFVMQRTNAVGQIILGNEPGMFAGDEKDVAKALFFERSRLAQHFVHG